MDECDTDCSHVLCLSNRNRVIGHWGLQLHNMMPLES